MSLLEFEVLLVEDDPGDAELPALAPGKQGLANRIEVARDGAEALDGQSGLYWVTVNHLPPSPAFKAKPAGVSK